MFVFFLDHLYWLGMTDEVVEGIWKWSDTDTKVEVTDWYPGEPQDAGAGEDCAVYSPGHEEFKWADVGCARKFLPLCEKQ